MNPRGVAAGACALPAFLVLCFAADPKAPLGLPPLSWPKENPYSAAKVELGRYLYFDRRLSADDTVSCASCHDPRFAFTDGAAVSTGIQSQKGNRSAPTIINRGYSLAQFWDGRAGTLEEQAKGPMANPIEMGNTHEAIVARLQGIAGYRPMFASAFGTDEITIDRAADGPGKEGSGGVSESAERRRLAECEGARRVSEVAWRAWRMGRASPGDGDS